MELYFWNFFSLWIFVAIARADEQRLLSYLLNSYDVGARPALNASQPLKVTFGMSLHLIVDVDERNQILTTNCWLTQKWHDAHLQWNASDFGGIRVIRIPYQRVWRPDVILYNNADAQYSSSMINTNVIVDSTGEIVWLSHGIFRSSCDINTEHFPFDVQECHMKWASWTYDGFQLDLVAETTIGDTSNYQANGEFDLIGFQADRNEKFYSCCPGEPYPDITYVIKLRRRPLFYVFNLILPCILINSIALLVFYVPPESGEKVTLGISSLLSMTVFLMTIRESLPPTEKTPLISLYYGVSICLVSFASGMSVVTLNLHHRGLRGVPVPYMVRKIVLGPLARVVFVHFHSKVASSSCSADALEQRRERKNDDSTSTDNWAQSVHGIGCAKCTGHRLRQKLQDLEPQAGVYLDPHCSEKFFYTQCDGERQPPSPRFFPRRNKPDMGDSSYEASVGRVLSRVSSWLDYNEARLEAQDKREALELEWKQVALVCDRSLLALFLVLTVLATCLILFSSPYGPW